MDKKVGAEKTELVKEEGAQKREYIFQKNTKTKTAVYIVAAFLVVLVIGLVVSKFYFGT